MDTFSWDSYVTTHFDDYSGFDYVTAEDPTSFRIINETTGECHRYLTTFIASFDDAQGPMGPIASWVYCGIAPEAK